MTTVAFDTAAIDATADAIEPLAVLLSQVRTDLRNGTTDVARPVSDALHAFGRNSAELIDEIEQRAAGTAKDLRSAATCYRSMEDSAIAVWGRGEGH